MNILILLKKINEVLIPWCDKNNKKISDVPLFADSTGKRHPLYTIVVTLRGEKDNLDKSTIQLLDSYGMT